MGGRARKSPAIRTAVVRDEKSEVNVEERTSLTAKNGGGPKGRRRDELTCLKHFDRGIGRCHSRHRLRDPSREVRPCERVVRVQRPILFPGRET